MVARLLFCFISLGEIFLRRSSLFSDRRDGGAQRAAPDGLDEVINVEYTEWLYVFSIQTVYSTFNFFSVIIQLNTSKIGNVELQGVKIEIFILIFGLVSNNFKYRL